MDLRRGIRAWHKYCRDGRDIATATAMKLNKAASTVNAILDCGTSFMDLLTSKVIHAHASRAGYHVSVLDALTNAIANDLISSDFLASDCWSRYVRYFCITTLALNQTTALPLLKKLSREGAGARNLRVQHVNDAKIYSSSEVAVELLLQANDFSQ